MSAVIGIYDNTKNIWVFSSCSINFMKTLLLYKNSIASNTAQCLANVPASADAVVNNFLNFYLGQLWTLDQQCITGSNYPGSSAEVCGVSILYFN